jgi:DNA-binding CsgD family transcriptional regulator
MIGMPRPRTALIGRTAELGELLRLLEDAPPRPVNSVVVSGDAGVGKTRLLAELTERAAEHQILTLIGHCLDFGEPGLPYLPFTEAFGRLARERPERIDALLRDVAAIARLLPTRRVLGASGELLDERIQRAELFDAVLTALLALAADGPVLLVIEDAHWADQSTRDLMGFLLARLGDDDVSLVVSYRSDDLHRRHPLRPAVAEWARLPKVERLHLAPLGAGEVRTLVRTLHPQPMPERQIMQIVNRADGNAFFAEELVAATEQSTDCDSVPAELAELLLVRVDRLSAPARRIVRIAAVAGHRVTHGLLSAVADLPDGELDAALREAIDSYVLEPRGEESYGFRHALLAEAVYDDLLPGERTRLHAGYAAALTKGGVDGTAAELARHAHESHDLPTAYLASVRAGDEAMRVAAPQEAMQHYEAALQLSAHAPADDADRGQLVRKAADAASDAGHPLRAVELIREALSQLPPDTHPTVRAKLLYDMATFVFAVESDDPLSWTTEAVGLMADEPPSAFRAKLMALHATGMAAMGRGLDATRWAQDALDMANDIGQPHAASDARTTLAVLQRNAGQPSAAARDLVAVAEDARHAGQLTVELRSRFNLGSLHYEQGDLDAAVDAFRSGVERATAAGRQWAPFGLGCAVLLALVQYVRGEWDASLQTTDIRGLPAPPMPEATLAAAALAVRAGRGEERVLDLLPVLRPWWRRDGMIAVLTAGPGIEMYVQRGQVAEAFELLDDVNSTLAQLWQNAAYLGRIRLSALAVAGASTAVVSAPAGRRAEWVERAASVVEAGRVSAEQGVPAGRRPGVEAVAWTTRLEAEWSRLRWLAGVDAPALETHIGHWERSVKDFGYGDVYEQARSRTRLAAVLRAAGRGSEAAEQAASAREVARGLRAEPLLAELRALGTARHATRDVESTGPAALTDRERDVLALLVDGRTNRQISQQLYISAKTVSVHVSNILTKLGVSSRAEAAALARRDPLPR